MGRALTRTSTLPGGVFYILSPWREVCDPDPEPLSHTGVVPSGRSGRFVMSKIQPHLPDMLPLLSRGKHRNPRKGACFMELGPTCR